MNNAARLTLLVTAALLAMPAAADEAAEAQDAPQPAAVTASVEELLEESAWGPRWQLTRPVAETVRSAAEWQQPMADLEFEDASGLARMVKLRSLSFLTLSNSGKSRLFIGVNEDGFVGLHFRAVTDKSDTAHRELARMPWLDAHPAEE